MKSFLFRGSEVPIGGKRSSEVLLENSEEDLRNAKFYGGGRMLV